MLTVQAAAKAIGLNAKLVSVSAANYFNFFSNPKVQATVDCFLTINYGDYADPSALYKTIVLANGSQNFSALQQPTGDGAARSCARNRRSRSAGEADVTGAGDHDQ